MENVSMSQPSLPITKAGSAKTTQDTKKSATPIGADRYEEIITTSRTRREGSQVMNKMIVIIRQSKLDISFSFFFFPFLTIQGIFSSFNVYYSPRLSQLLH